MNVTGNATKTAMMTAMRDTCANGTIELLSAANQVLAIIGLSSTGGTISGSTNSAWTFAFDGPTVGESAAGAGTNASSARMKTAGGAVQTTLTVTLTGGGGDLQMDNLSISSGQAVNLTAGSFNWP